MAQQRVFQNQVEEREALEGQHGRPPYSPYQDVPQGPYSPGAQDRQEEEYASQPSSGLLPDSPYPQGSSNNRRYSQEAAGAGAGTGAPQASQPRQSQPSRADNRGEAASGGMAARGPPDYPRQVYQQGHDQLLRSGTSTPQIRDSSHASLTAPFSPAISTAGRRTPSRSPHRFAASEYDPYGGYSTNHKPELGFLNVNEIDDDADDGVEYGRKEPRTSMLSLGGSSHRGREGTKAAGAVGGAAAGGVLTRNKSGQSGQYAPVHKHNAPTAYGGAGAMGLEGLGGPGGPGSEKTYQWEQPGRNRSQKWRLAIIIVIGLMIAAGVIGGIFYGLVLNKEKDDKPSAPKDTTDLDLHSPEIQALLNNKGLHKVFPGIDYTPLNTQYPDCVKSPPSQNNITKDVALLTQLSNTIRLYGTDCNQTEMVMHALGRLGLADKVKIWLGVWQDNNATTNDRQLRQMWNILDAYGSKPFQGVIVANEVLFRQQMTVTELGSLLSSVRANLTARGLSLPVATSDLGDKWTGELAQQSDYIMSNIHPFFAGENAKTAAAWTWSFWQAHNDGFAKADASKNVISEVGWPTEGGTDCGTTAVTDCPDASVAGIDQLNRLMADWVCQALANGTNYFWFEAFDEPWKVRFNSGDKNWEDHWGLMDVDRNLKPGVSIPDCGGKTV